MTTTFDAAVLETALEKAFSNEKIETGFFSSGNWEALKAISMVAFSFASSHVTSSPDDEPIIPTLIGMRDDGGLVFGAIPDMLNSDVHIRRALHARVPKMMQEMDVKTTILLREAWTVELSAAKDEMADATFRQRAANILPSQDDRRVSTMMADFYYPDGHFLVNFRINEKAERSIDFDPMNIIIDRHDNKKVHEFEVPNG